MLNFKDKDPFEGREKQLNLDLGDVELHDSGDLGIDIFNKFGKGKGKKVLWLNQASELALLEWLKKKYPEGRDSRNVLLGLRQKS
jgi:hypothetical protein